MDVKVFTVITCKILVKNSIFLIIFHSTYHLTQNNKIRGAEDDKKVINCVSCNIT